MRHRLILSKTYSMSGMCLLFFNDNIAFNMSIAKEQISKLDVPEVLHQNPSLSQETSDDQYLRFASSPNSDNGTNTKIIIKSLLSIISNHHYNVTIYAYSS